MPENGLMPGGEPFYFPGDKSGCLLIHGFTGAPQEVRWLGEHLAQQGYTVHAVRLAGHGTNLRDMGRTTWRDWYTSVLDGYHLLRQTCERVFIVGVSMGGALGLLLAANELLDGLVSLSAPFRLSGPRIRLAGLLHPVLYSVPKSNVDDLSERVATLQARRGERVIGHVSYSARPLISVVNLASLLNEMRLALPQVTRPVLLMHARHDTLVPFEHLQYISEAVSSPDKTMVPIENGNHVVTEDVDRSFVFKAVAEFIAAHI